MNGRARIAGHAAAPDEIVFRRGRMIATVPMSRKAMRAGNVDYHDLSGMVARMLGRDTANPIA